MNKPLVILGGGGHALVLLDILRQQNRQISAIVCPKEGLNEGLVQFLENGITHLHQDDEVFTFQKQNVELVNAVGFMPRNHARQSLFEKFNSAGYQFASVIASSADVSATAKLGQGVQVLHKAVVQASSEIGENTIINSAAVVEHECQIGSHNHIAPGAVLCASVTTDLGVFIGSRSAITQNNSIGADTIIGAGAIVTKDVASRCIVYPPKSQINSL